MEDLKELFQKEVTEMDLDKLLIDELDKFLWGDNSDNIVSISNMIDLVNCARDDYPRVSRILIKGILVVKRMHKKMWKMENTLTEQYDEARSGKETLYMLKSDENPYHGKVRGPTTFAQSQAKKETAPLKFQLEEVGRKKDSLWDVKVALEQVLHTCDQIFANRDRVTPSGEMVDKDRILNEMDDEVADRLDEVKN